MSLFSIPCPVRERGQVMVRLGIRTRRRFVSAFWQLDLPNQNMGGKDLKRVIRPTDSLCFGGNDMQAAYQVSLRKAEFLLKRTLKMFKVEPTRQGYEIGAFRLDTAEPPA
ncbi:MAG: hypothetical protein ACRD9S_22860 [Pyrinomonadaceae bacterium]